MHDSVQSGHVSFLNTFDSMVVQDGAKRMDWKLAQFTKGCGYDSFTKLNGKRIDALLALCYE